MMYPSFVINLELGNLQSGWESLLQLLGLVLIGNDQSVQVSGTSDFELGLLGNLAGSVDLLVNLDGGGLNVGSSGQLQELLDVFDFSLRVCVSTLYCC